jgi:phosphoribosylanthranilate isomerase
MTIRAKICGINEARAMEAALDGGAAFVGLVFYAKSPRAVTPDEAHALAKLAKGKALRVGLFVDPDDAEIERVRESLDMIQLHGKETPERVAAIRAATGLEAMKAISVSVADDIAFAQEYLDAADWLLFDAKPPKSLANALPGGNAIAFDWALLSGRQWPLPWMLAGGLTIENVAEAIRITGAKVVDTSSGVEDAPGRKNPKKIRAFLARVAAAG